MLTNGCFRIFMGLMVCALAGCGQDDLPSHYGADAGEWAADGVCQDPRFTGSPTVDERSRGRDASDCRALVNAGAIGVPDMNAILGDDSGDYAHDGECDDPYFEGSGMAWPLVMSDRGRDASDCRSLFEAGNIRLR